MSDRSTKVARLQFLGALRVEMGSEVVTPEAERLFAMLVRLSVPLGRIVARQTVMDTIWPGVDDANARHNLRQTIYKAREVGLVIDASEDGLRLDPRYWSCDWEDPTGDVPGEWLAGYDPAFSPALEAWVVSRRGGVHAQLRPRMVRSLQAARAAGDYRNANKYALELLAIDELNEEATLTRAEVLVMQGAKADALRLLDAYLVELGLLSAGEDAALPARLLRKRIAEKLPILEYHRAEKHLGPLVGRAAELQQLVSGLFEARAGRGGAVLIHGTDGMGKSRLLHEVRKAALLQDVSVLELTCDTASAVMPFATMRTLVRRLLDYPGAIGVSPEALATLRAWLASQAYAPDDCPVAEIEDLLAAVSEEKPLVLQIEGAHRIDAETLDRLDRIYRRGQPRCHMAILASATAATPTERPVELTWIERLPLRPLLTVEVRGIIEAIAKTEYPRATPEQVTFASVFAEGVPMYGIEMLGLMLDEGSPDVIPFRVQVAVDRVLRELSELQWRILALAWELGDCSTEEIISAGVKSEGLHLEEAFNALEIAGYLQKIDGSWRPSPLLSVEATGRLRAATARMDSLRASRKLYSMWQQEGTSIRQLVTAIRLLIQSGHDDRAAHLLNKHAPDLILREKATVLLFEFNRMREAANASRLQSVIDDFIWRITSGALAGERGGDISHEELVIESLPPVSRAGLAFRNEFGSQRSLDDSLEKARDPNATPAARLSEAVTALIIADNRGEAHAVHGAQKAIDAVRHARDVHSFDLRRADCISAAMSGDRQQAMRASLLLAEESRKVPDISLACTGLRNASDCLSGFGDHRTAQSLLHEARALSRGLEYDWQTLGTDLALAGLAIECMDTDGALAYTAAAEQLLLKNRIHSSMDWAEVHYVRSWAFVMRGQLVDAGKAAKLSRRGYDATQVGNGLSARLNAKLASHTGAFSREIEREFDTLLNTVGKGPFPVHDERSLVALILVSANTHRHEAAIAAAKAAIPRIIGRKNSVWPLLSSLLAAHEA